MTVCHDTHLSVLDFSPVVSGALPSQALRDTVTMAEHADRLGYERYWLAEHHNMPCAACCSPPVLIDRVACATSSLRVGSGGTMLLNHSPLLVAEQFGMLEALHPGRIDLGVARNAGTDPATARLLRRSTNSDDFALRLAELLGYFEPLGEGQPPPPVTAVPARGNQPPVHLLGSDGNSAKVAGTLGLPFSFAHHSSPEATISALDLYRRSFQPSSWLSLPYTIVSAIVVAADTDERAEWLAGTVALASLLQRSKGLNDEFPHPAEAAKYPGTPEELQFLRGRVGAHLVGGPQTLRRKVAALIEETQTDELMVMALVHGVDDRIRTLEILADVTARQPRRTPDP